MQLCCGCDQMTRPDSVCVCSVPFLSCTRRLCETVVPLEDPIITETTSTLQEWGVLWKQLYVVSLHLHTDENKTLSSRSTCDRIRGGFICLDPPCLVPCFFPLHLMQHRE